MVCASCINFDIKSSRLYILDLSCYRSRRIFIPTNAWNSLRILHTSSCSFVFERVDRSDTSRIIANDCLVTPPAQRVQFILGEEVGDDAHESHPLFSEMEELIKDGDEMEWKETAR